MTCRNVVKDLILDLLLVKQVTNIVDDVRKILLQMREMQQYFISVLMVSKCISLISPISPATSSLH